MTREELVAWATRNGFEADGDRLTCLWGERTIRIELLGRGVSVHADQGDASMRLGGARSLDAIGIDEFGIVSGIGLGMSLAASVDRGDPPPWFPDELVRKLSQVSTPSL